MTPLQEQELKEFYENVRKMRIHQIAYRRDHSSQDWEAAKKYEKKVDRYIIHQVNIARSKKREMF